MNQQYYFGEAKWVGAYECSIASGNRAVADPLNALDLKPTSRRRAYVLRGRFTAGVGARAMLNVLGLGFFQCYINGALINPDTFLPLSSDFEATNDPAGEVLAGHRIYVPQFDITPYLAVGENVIALHFGGGYKIRFKKMFFIC